MKFAQSTLAFAVTIGKNILLIHVRTLPTRMRWESCSLLLRFTIGTVGAQMGLFERSLDNHIKTICGVDIISPTPPPTKSPSEAPSLAPSVSSAPTILEKACDDNVGAGICLDSAGNPFDYCTSNAFQVSAKTCKSLAVASSDSVGWQYGAFGIIPGVCTIYFDNADSGDDVRSLCPKNFSGLSTRSGTGFPVSAGSGLSTCFACNKK